MTLKRIGYLSLLNIFRYTLCKEIIATDEWTLVQEGDTIPAGLHVRIDFSTGQKWVKLLHDDDEENDHSETRNVKSSSVSSVSDSLIRTTQEADTKSMNHQNVPTRPLRITHLTEDSTQTISKETSNRILSNFQRQQEIHKNKLDSISKLNDFTNDIHKEETDYMTMYRTLLTLPLEEQERFGGIPLLPISLSSNITDSINMDEALMKQQQQEIEKEEFIQKIRSIWSQRQEELQQIQESLVDAPKWMQQQISYLQDFLLEPLHRSLSMLENTPSESSSSSSPSSNILSTLYELEFQVCDVDMARDFHTLGGWPILSSLLLLNLPYSLSTSSSSSSVKDIPVHAVMDVLSTYNPIYETFYSTRQNNESAAVLNNHNPLLTTQAMLQSLTWEIHGFASWVIGSAVKNVDEFHSWALEDLSSQLTVSHNKSYFTDLQQHHVNITMIDVLLSNLASNTLSSHDILMHKNENREWNLEHWLLSFIRKRQKELYALGSMLRGNHAAVERFIRMDGPSTLLHTMETIAEIHVLVDSSPTLEKNIANLKSKASNLVLDLMQSHNLYDPRFQPWIIQQEMDTVLN